jgi:hypothetical protein
MSRINCWDNADALAMAVRLRQANNCPGEIDNLYGEIVASMVNMATALLVQAPKYRQHRDELMSPDVQGTMLLHALTALEKNVDTRSPRKLVNYCVKVVQNRLRNHVRDTTRRKARIEFVSESVLGIDISEVGPVACNLDGRRVTNEKSHKVDTVDRNLN